MKKTLLLTMICLLLAAPSAFAYQVTNRLQVTAYNNSPILVNLDGTNYGPFTNSQTIENLSPGLHQMQVIALEKDNYTLSNYRQVIYTGNITICDGRNQVTVVNPDNTLQIVADNSLIIPQPRALEHFHQDIFYQQHFIGNNPAPIVPVVQGPQAMCEAEFMGLVNTVNHAWFDDGKLVIVREALAHHFVNTYQVKQLMGLFSFETSKLQVAEMAYRSTVDQANYYQVNDAFWFQSSIADLANYINTTSGLACSH